MSRDYIIRLENEIYLQKEEIASLKEALKYLWEGTVWGAGKGAVAEFYNRELRSAGIQIGT